MQHYNPGAWRRKLEGRVKKEEDIERRLMRVLLEFGYSIDPHGYDDGDYDTAMNRLASLFFAHGVNLSDIPLDNGLLGW